MFVFIIIALVIYRKNVSQIKIEPKTSLKEKMDTKGAYQKHDSEINELTRFVKVSLKNGFSKEETRKQLIEVGWKKDIIDEVMRYF